MATQYTSTELTPPTYSTLGGSGAPDCRMTVAVRDVAPILIDAIGVMPYAAIGPGHADPVDPMPTHEPHALLRELSAETVDEILAACGPASNSPRTIVELRLLGGALAHEPRHRSAFCHRNAAYALSVIGVLAPPAGGGVVGHAAALVYELTRWSTGGQMPNFAPSADPTWLTRCYNEDTLHCLRALAHRYDPASVMR
ncbi:MAG: hypothetical protein QOI01_4801 [Mycobacterium sp.]|nr:hypothetical protein [Mycobacterium sp.]